MLLCIHDGLGNPVAVWSLHVSVLKSHELADAGGKGAAFDLPLSAFSGGGDLPSDERRWRYLVSRFSATQDGELTDLPQVAAARGDRVSVKLKATPLMQTRHCQVPQ